uniref:IkappaB kinase n=1 Tax=Caenorhabditis tropicalis TaxID=1561998 RepID=A0A1I7U5Q0_9PELO
MTSSSPPKPYPRIRTIGEKYTLFNDDQIGRGAYSEVYKGRTESGQLVAVKTACKNVEIKAIKVEIDILMKLTEANTQNIVKFIGSTYEQFAPGSVTPEVISFAMEYAKSSLEAEMRRPANLKGLPADVLIDLVVDCSMALSALREHNIAHRDIKHMNILLFPGTATRGRRSTNLFKLCDMGCSKELLAEKNEMRTLVGTPNLLHPHLARELVGPQKDRHSWTTKLAYTPEQCDLWSLGCTLYYCATGRLPFDHDKKDSQVYHDAADALTRNPDAIAMNIRQRGGAMEFEAVTELPSRFTRYPKWLVCTMTCLLRSFFHAPSIDFYSKVALAMRTGRRRSLISVDQLSTVDHTDMFLDSIPSISECLGYPQGTSLALLSNTSTQHIDPLKKSLSDLPDDVYLVLPALKEVVPRPINLSSPEFREMEDMNDRRLVDIRVRKCYEGLSALTETDECVKAFDTISTILATRFNLLVKELSEFERVQTASRFAVYVDMASVPVMLLDETNSQMKWISEKCIEKAKQSREELELHAKTAMRIGEMARRLAKDSEDLRLDDMDLPGIREEVESYFFMDKQTILETRVYSQKLVDQCFRRRDHVIGQVLTNDQKAKKALDLAESLKQLRSNYENLQNLISDCLDSLERPFQEMRDVVNRCLVDQGHSRTSMQKSMHFLAPEFKENQMRIKKSTKSSRKLMSLLDKEMEELGFVRMGDTLVRRPVEEDKDEQGEELEEKEEEGTLKKTEEAPEIEIQYQSSLSVIRNSERNDPDASADDTSSSDTSFESTPPGSPSNDGSTFFRTNADKANLMGLDKQLNCSERSPDLGGKKVHERSE